MIVKVITKEALVELRRQARRQRKEDRERLLNTTGRDVIEMLHRDLSWSAKIAPSSKKREAEPRGSPLPELPSDEVVGAYEDKGEIRLLLFARDAGGPVVTNFGYIPSKLCEERVRHSAKIRGCRLHFYRLIDGNIAIEVESDARFLKTSDARFLGKLGVTPM